MLLLKKQPPPVNKLAQPPAGNRSTIGVLLLHGLTGNPSEMKPVAQGLQAKGYRVSIPLLAGHGGTHRDLLATTWQDWLDSARKALADLQKECDQVFIGGLSMSTLLAVVLAAETPNLGGIFLCSTTYGVLAEDLSKVQFLLPLSLKIPFLYDKCYWEERPPYGLKDERLQKIITRSIESAKKGQTANFGLFRTYLGSIRQVNLLIKQTRKVAANVQCPALILHSLEDTVAPIENATRLFADLGTSQKEVRLITGTNHVMTVDLQKHFVTACFSDFISQNTLSLSPELSPSVTSSTSSMRPHQVAIVQDEDIPA